VTGLTRRRSKDAKQECWQIFYEDVQVGTIGLRAGVPGSVDQWGWECGFYPLSHRGQHLSGTAASFNDARDQFDAAWRVYLPKCTEQDFRDYRDQRNLTARKYAMWEAGEKLPTQTPSSIMPCVCGVRFDAHKPQESYLHRQHICARGRRP
jgi:hypothetical protein